MNRVEQATDITLEWCLRVFVFGMVFMVGAAIGGYMDVAIVTCLVLLAWGAVSTLVVWILLTIEYWSRKRRLK